MAKDVTSAQVLKDAEETLEVWVATEIRKCEITIADVTSPPSWTLYCARRKELLIKMQGALAQ